MDHSLVVLGSGQDGGSPQVGSRGATAGHRMASSVALTDEEGGALLFDASPDLRTQYELLGDTISALPRLEGVFVTHAHMGHYTGLVHFGREAAATEGLPLFAPESVIRFLASNEPWRSLIDGGHLDPVPMDGSTATLGDVAVSDIPVPHRDEHSTTVAFSIALDDVPWALYLPDIDDWDDWPSARDVVAEHRVALLDATFSAIDELPGRDVAAIAHPLVTDTIQRFADLTDGTRIVLTHVNHSNPVGDPTSDVHRAAVEAGFEVAYDGMVITHG